MFMRVYIMKQLMHQSFRSVGNELSSRLVSKQVLLPQQSLTSVFGMGTGGPSALKSRIKVPLQSKEESFCRKETQTL